MSITTDNVVKATNMVGTTYDFDLVAVDMYRDIHKGIRAELFDLTLAAGRVDPGCRADRAAVAGHVASVGQVLELHAHHEDLHVEPALLAHAPSLADQISTDHHVLEARFNFVNELAQATVDAVVADQRRLMHLLYLELSGFTSAYLAHQQVEERVVMPAIERAIGPQGALGIHVAVVSSIPPEVMARSLAFMLPAMNIDNRTELLTGMKMTAPPEAFDAVMGLASSVLEPADFSALAARL
jgi:hemerythrin HHE cation binding domain-containing protein